MTKMVNTQGRMTIGSEEYLKEAKKIQQMKAILAQHYEDLNKVQKGWSFKGMAEGFNKYFGIVAAGVATVTGIIYSMNQATKASNDFEEKLANLGAITGLTGNSLEWMGKKAKEMSTSTLEGGIHITKSADDIVDAFTKMGSARPELLKNKEALALVTEKALILAEASKMEMQPAIDAVAASMNQFNLGASEANRIINVLGAGSLEGSAEVADLTESLKNVGTVAASSNMTLEQTVAALEVLGEKQLKGVEGGTKLRGALLKMKEAGVGYTSGQFNMRDALSEVNKKLEAQTSNIEKDALKQKMFGIENITAGDILLQNVDKYDKLTIAVTGTDVAIQQAAKNTATNTALMAQAKSEFHNASIELGKNLSPAMTMLYQMAGSVAAAFSKMIATSPAQALEQEGTLVNRLATELANSNTPLERRKVILNEIKEINPKIAEGLDAEKINYKTLTGNIQAYNAELSNRILLENLSTDEKKFATQSAKYKERFGDAQIKINEIISQTDQALALSNASMEEKTAKTLEILKSKAGGVVIAVSGAVADGRNKEAIALLQLQGWIERSTQAQNDLNKSQGKEVNFANRIKQLREILGIQEEIKNEVTPPKPSKPTGPASLTDEQIKEQKKASDKSVEQLDASNNKIMSSLISQYEKEGWTDARFKAQQLLAEQAYLEEKKKILKDNGQSIVEVDNQINQKRIETQKEFNALAASEQKQFDDIQAQVNEDTFNEDQDLYDRAGKELIANLETDNKKEKKVLEDRARTYQMISETIVSSMSDMLSGSLEEQETYGEALILMSLQILKQMAPIWAAQMLGLSLSSPESVASWGVAGLAEYTLLLGLMEGGIALAENGVKNNIKKKQEAKAAKHAAGGFTHGEETYIAGEAGQEWIAPNWQLNNPITGPIIAALERWRRNPVTVTPGAMEASQRPSNSKQFDISKISGSSGTNTNPVQPSTDQDLKRILEENTNAMMMNSHATALLMKHGVSFPIVPFIGKFNAYSQLLSQTGMPGFKGTPPPVYNKITNTTNITNNNTTNKSLF